MVPCFLVSWCQPYTLDPTEKSVPYTVGLILLLLEQQ